MKSACGQNASIHRVLCPCEAPQKTPQPTECEAECSMFRCLHPAERDASNNVPSKRTCRTYIGICWSKIGSARNEHDKLQIPETAGAETNQTLALLVLLALPPWSSMRPQMKRRAPAKESIVVFLLLPCGRHVQKVRELGPNWRAQFNGATVQILELARLTSERGDDRVLSAAKHA